MPPPPPLLAHSIPPTLLSLLTLRTSQPLPAPPAAEAADQPEPASSSSLSCSTCLGVVFESVEEQRAHVKGDWHRWNLRASLAGGKGRVLTEEEFAEIDDGISSLSGSESASSPSTSSHPAPTSHLPEADNPTTHSRALSTTSSDLLAQQTHDHARAASRTALIWFSPDAAKLSALPAGERPCAQDTQYGVYRALLPPTSSPADFLPALRAIQLPPTPSSAADIEGERKFTILMSAGGHFAGMVVGLRPLSQGGMGKGGQKPERQEVKGAGEVRVIAHKTFHRYTTRKKQGGSQSTNDNAKSKANSAGAMLRRYGEQSLKEEIQALLITWKSHLDTSEKIFLRASTAGKRAFWGYEGAVLEKGDGRVGGVPFPTRRPTLSELLRVFRELTTVKISHLSESALLALETEYILSLAPRRTVPAPAAPTPAPKPSAPKLTPQELALRDLRERYLEMITKHKLVALQSFWEKHGAELGGVEGRVGEEGEERYRGWTGLMIAASAGWEEGVGWMLEGLRADPTAFIGGSSVGEEAEGGPVVSGKPKTAYDLATTKPTRNIFRRLAHSNPDWWDWQGAGHVPSGLSEEQEAEQDRKKGERRKGMREKAREREAKREKDVSVVGEEKVEPVVVKKEEVKTGPQKLGGGRTAGGEAGMAGLSEEMRMRVERERRARAAEARLGGGGK